MTSTSEQAPQRLDAEGRGIGISAVERETGIRRETLRIWERRYGFPQPGRDAAGERLYPAEQVDRLRLIKRLLDLGHRPGRVVQAPEPQLQGWLSSPRLARQGAASPPGLERRAARGIQVDREAGAATPLAGDITEALERLKRHDVEALRQSLTQALLRQGLAGAVTQLFAPLTTAVGEAWMRGELQVFEEHVYSESLQLVLRQALQSLPAPSTPSGPRVLLTTLPGENHVLGLLMAEAMFSLEGATCLSLGAQTPVDQIVPAMAAHRADVLALSFSPVLTSRAVQEGLARLRTALPAEVEIWAGGSHRALRAAGRPADIQVLPELAQIPEEVDRWRSKRA